MHSVWSDFSLRHVLKRQVTDRSIYCELEIAIPGPNHLLIFVRPIASIQKSASNSGLVQAIVTPIALTTMWAILDTVIFHRSVSISQHLPL